MKLPSLISFAGFVIIIAATYCPILRILHLFNWDVYDGNKPYGVIMLLVAVVGILGTALNQAKLIKFTAWLSFGLVVLFYGLIWLKLYTSFGFISINSSGVAARHGFFSAIEKPLMGIVKFRWGIYVLFAGGILAVTGTLSKNSNLNKITVDA